MSEQVLDITTNSIADNLLSNGLTLKDIDSVPTDEASFDFPSDLPPEMKTALLDTQKGFIESLRQGVGLGRCFIIANLKLKYAGFTRVPGRFTAEPSAIRLYGFSQSHSWSEYNDVIYEFTGAQFNDRLPKTDLFPLGLNIIRPGGKMYNAFVPHEPRHASKPSRFPKWLKIERNRQS